ncbi:hypothetical protein ACLOAV_002923 [Pseudogymnoascus australis]
MLFRRVLSVIHLAGLFSSGYAISSIGVTTTACKTVAGVALPTPTGSVCGGSGSSYSLTGTGTLINYSAGSPQAASLAACSAQCLATATCSGIYFIQGLYCNLKYGPRAFLSGAGNPQFSFYDASCFPICDGSGSSYALTGSGTLINYSAGSPQAASLAACSAQCLATATCSGIYFIQGLYCNLKYGPRAFLSGAGNPQFAYYDAHCFKCVASTPTPTPSVCRTVDGVISPTPETAICGGSGSSFAMADTGTIIGYGAGTVYVSSIAACSARCLATVNCSSIYFIQGRYCNLKYGPRAFLSGQGSPPYQFYESSCFKCPASSIATTSAPSSSKTFSPTATSTSVTTTAPCGIVSGVASPTPAGAICGAKGSSYTLAGSGTLIHYGVGSPYVASIAACGAQCLATSCCTSIYFIKDQYCNLKYGLKAFGVNTGNPQFDFYEASCFTCGPLSCSTSTTAYNMELTTTFTQPARCSWGVVTQMAYSGNGIWKNAIIPVPTSTITSCFPTQFADSVIAKAVSSTILPPFAKL